MAEGRDDEGDYVAERPLGHGEFPHFYYTPDENDYDRYFTERKLWQKLCRGETKPIVSLCSFCFITLKMSIILDKWTVIPESCQVTFHFARDFYLQGPWVSLTFIQMR